MLLQRKKVLLLLGAGGVGKTSCSVAVALRAASMGKKVALLSIDPAKRLAAAMGIELGGQLRTVEGAVLAGAGRLDAAMLDPKTVFDGMVRRYAPNRATQARILANPLYRVASTQLAGSMEFMALAQLQEIMEMAEYDLVIVDTPPDTQALQFLQTPNILASFMEKRVMQWLIRPFYFASKLGLGRLANWGEKLMGNLAKVTGFHALRSLVDFLVLIQAVMEGFHQHGLRIVQTLRGPDAGFLLVTSPHPPALRAAENLIQHLHQVKYALDGVILNRCFPAALRVPLLALEPPFSPLVGYMRARVQEEIDAKISLQKTLPADFHPFVIEVEAQSHVLSSVEALQHLSQQLG